MIKLEITTKWHHDVIQETCKTMASSIRAATSAHPIGLHITLDRGTDKERGYCQVTSIKVL